MALLSREDVDRRLTELTGWTLAGKAIQRQYEFAGFPEAVAFINRLVPGAEHADHHPDLQLNYKRVTVTYSTHDAGGLTDKDFAGAAMADREAAKVV